MFRPVLAVVWIALSAHLALGDVFVLTNDGRVSGKLVNLDESPRSTYIVETAAGARITLDKSQVKSVTNQSPAELKYQEIRTQYPDDADSQWKLAEWCRENNLSRQRAVHLERVIHHQPDHLLARRGLGYIQLDGRWARQEDIMKERGYVLYKGQWKLPQEIELIEAKRKSAAEERRWFTQLKSDRALLDEGGAKAKQALERIRAISHPDAVPAILEAFKSDQDEGLRTVYLKVLGQIGTDPAVRALVEVALASGNEELRITAVEELKRGGHAAAAGHFVQALRAKDNVRINRAGAALGELGDKSAVGPLIDALVTDHKVKLQQGSAGSLSPAFGSDGSMSFGSGQRQVIVKNTAANRDIHDALVKLTGGKDFGFDVKAWKYWHAAQKKAPPPAGRRD